MRIVQISSHINGSVGKIMRSIDSALRANGDESYILYARGNCERRENYIKINNKAGIYFDALLSRIFDNAGCNSRLSTRKVIRLLKKINPQVVHIHCLHGYYINYPMLFRYLKKTGVKVVWTMHDCWAFTGHCCYYSYAACEKWQTGCRKCKCKASYPKSALYNGAKRNYNHKRKIFTSLAKENVTLVTPSLWLKEEVAKSFLNGYDCKVVYNGIPLDIYRPVENNLKADIGISGSKMILGVANVWEPRKGLNDFIRLSKSVGEKYKIVLVGVNKAQKEALPANVIGVSRTDSLEELLKYYTAADWFFNPSVEETFGMTIIEALACGTPVLIYSRTAAMREIVDGKTGLVFDGLKDVEKFFSEKEDKTRISSEDCIARAKEFGDEIMNKKYLSVYGVNACGTEN